MGDEFEGMESPHVFCLVNGSLGSCPSILPLALTRANSHLVVLSQDFRNIMQEAVDRRLAKRGQHGMVLPPLLHSLPPTGVKEVVEILCSQARILSPESLGLLATTWGVEEEYRRQGQQGRSRHLVMQALLAAYQVSQPDLTIEKLINSLTCISDIDLAQRVKDKLSSNLTMMMRELQDRIVARHLTADAQVELAHSLGQRQLFNSLTQPTDPSVPAVEDTEALVTCLKAWESGATGLLTTEDLFNCLLKTGVLTMIVDEMRKLLENSSNNDEQRTNLGINMKEALVAADIDVLLPIFKTIMSFIFLVLLFNSSSLQMESIYFTCFLWLPAAPVLAIHMYCHYRFYSHTLSRTDMITMLVLQPVASTAIHLRYIIQSVRFQDQEVARFRMRRLLHLADAAKIANNLTSFTVLALILHLLITENIGKSDAALFSFGVITLALHFTSLIINMTKEQCKGTSMTHTYLFTWLAISTLTIKLTSSTILLSSNIDTTPTILSIFCLVSLLLGMNFMLEKRCVRPQQEDEEDDTWLHAAHSLLMPLVPHIPGPSVRLGTGLQLLSGNLLITGLSFTLALTSGARRGLFLTDNLIQALCFNTIIFTVLSSIFHVIALNKIFSNSPAEDGDVDNTNNVKERISKICSLLLPLHLCLSMGFSFILLFYFFNTCPAVPSPSHQTSNTICLPTYQSSSSSLFTCSWRGTWSVELTCSPQIAMIIGPGPTGPLTEMYPTANRTLPALPYKYTSAAYLSGEGVMVCGGMNQSEQWPGRVSSCHSLSPPELQWRETSYPLLEVSKHCAIILLIILNGIHVLYIKITV